MQSACITFQHKQNFKNTTQSRSSQRQSSQSITWLILTNKTVQENTQTKHNSEQRNNTKHSKTKLSWFSHLMRHSARKQDGLILQHSHVLTSNWSPDGVTICKLAVIQATYICCIWGFDSIDVACNEQYTTFTSLKWNETENTTVMMNDPG